MDSDRSKSNLTGCAGGLYMPIIFITTQSGYTTAVAGYIQNSVHFSIKWLSLTLGGIQYTQFMVLEAISHVHWKQQ